MFSLRCVANFSHGVAHQLELDFSLWIKSVRFSRVLGVRLALLLFNQQMPRAQHCDSVIYTPLAGDLCPSIVPSASRHPRVTSRILQKLLFLKELQWVKKQFPVLTSDSLFP